MNKIISAQNLLIKQACALREARERRQQAMTLIDGAREIKRALSAGIILDKVFYLQNQPAALLKELSSRKITAIEVGDKVMEKLAYGERHDGIVAMARTPVKALRDLKLSPEPLVMVLESLEKPGNLGAI